MSTFSIPALFLGPLHLLTYSSVLGMQLYQTFILTRLSHRAIPTPHFRSLQKSVFPAYFTLQLLLVAAVAATRPPYSLMSLLLASWVEIVPIAVMAVTACLNWGLYGPLTLRVMIELAHQETRDGRRYGDEVKSEEMKDVMRQFSRAHAMSIHVNLITIIATLWYGFVLASKLSYRSTESARK